MAAIISCSALSSTRASSKPGSTRKTDQIEKKPTSSVSWWAPLFGLSSEPDYITSSSSSEHRESDLDKTDQRYLRRCLTEEKAKQLRKKIAEVSTFHDGMYHSSIASRLASDVSVRSKE